MNALKNNERGLSLVEVTIMLLVLMLLTGVLAPSIYDFVNDAKWVKVKEDCEAIGLSVARLTRDVGPCLKFEGNKPCYMSNRVDLIHSDGPAVVGGNLGATAVDIHNMNLSSQTLNWDYSARADSMENQFVTNNTLCPYPTPSTLGTYGSAGPQTGLGWRGAYLSPPIGSDPWGHQYLANTAFLTVALDANNSGEGHKGGGWSVDTFCISAGPNGLYETAIGGNGHGGVNRTGDDFIYIIAGGSR